MLWFSKKERPKKEEIESIKKSVTKPEPEGHFHASDFTENFPPREGFEPKELALGEAEERKSTLHSPYAPLFIKLEKYQLIIQRIRNLSEILKNTIEIIKVSDELERIREEIVRTLLKNLQEASKTVNFLDAELAKPLPLEREYAFSQFQSPESENLEKELERLRMRLEELKKHF